MERPAKDRSWLADIKKKAFSREGREKREEKLLCFCRYPDMAEYGGI